MTTISLRAKKSIRTFPDQKIMHSETSKRQFRVKDPGSALTHCIAMLTAILGAGPLLCKAAVGDSQTHFGAFVTFILSMICLYGASTIYHTFDISEKTNCILRKIDHAMIFVLIAGSYTPVCLITLPKSIGLPLLTTVWVVALVGTVFMICWITCPRWVSSTLYICMGWLVVFAFSPIMKNLSTDAFLWLLIGGIIYTVGGIIYALKLPLFGRHQWKYFGNHELFHCFVMVGSLCHYILVYKYIA